MNLLFVGNSYTYYNDMPRIFSSLARENGYDVCVDSVTKGGRKLFENLNPKDEHQKYQQLVALCAEKHYDVLILQEQSYFALVDYEKFLEGILGLIELINPARVILYATWGRKSGCPLLDELNHTTESMTHALLDAYGRAASTCGAQLSPVGSAFEQMTAIAPEIDLYHADRSHPSAYGSMLAALVHYGRVFGEMPTRVSSLSVDASQAALLCDAARSVLFSV